jgi:hypothetical protein
MDPKVLAEAQALEAAKKYDDPRYEELLFGTYYVLHGTVEVPGRRRQRCVLTCYPSPPAA